MIDTTINFYTLEKTYPITMNELDMQYRIKPASLLNLMQDAASRNIAGTPFGNVELNNEGSGWFLVRYRIEFDNYPSHIDEIHIQTENRGTMRQSAYRDFEVFAPDNSRERALSPEQEFEEKRRKAIESLNSRTSEQF